MGDQPITGLLIETDPARVEKMQQVVAALETQPLQFERVESVSGRQLPRLTGTEIDVLYCWRYRSRKRRRWRPFPRYTHEHHTCQLLSWPSLTRMPWPQAYCGRALRIMW